MGIPVVRVGARLPAEAIPAARAGERDATAGVADLWYPPDERASRELVANGVSADRVHCAGDLLSDAVNVALRARLAPSHVGAFHRMVIPTPSRDGRYVLVLVEEAKHVADRHRVVGLLAFLRRISQSIALVLVLRSDAEREFDKHRMHRDIFGDLVVRLPAQAYANHVELLRNATCVLTDSPDVRAEAIALQTPCLAIGIGAGAAGTSTSPTPGIGGRNHAAWAAWPHPISDDLPESPDGSAGVRIAEHFSAWLKRSRSSTAHLVTERNREQVHTPATPSPLP